MSAARAVDTREVRRLLVVPLPWVASVALAGAAVAQPGVTSPVPAPLAQAGVTATAPGGIRDQGLPAEAASGESVLAAAIPDPPAVATRPKPDYLMANPGTSGRSEPGATRPSTVAPHRPSPPPTAPFAVDEAVPQRVSPPPPIAAPPDTVRFGAFETPRPDWLARDAAAQCTAWAALGEAQIAAAYDRAGFSPQESDRRAASTTAGAVGGAALGAAAAGIPAALGGAVAGAGGGALVGAVVGGIVGGVAVPAIGAAPGAAVGALIGAGTGAAAGAGVVGGAAAVAGAVTGAVAGGAAGNALGAGDANAAPGPPPPLIELPAPPNIEVAVVIDDAADAVADAVEWAGQQPAGAEMVAAATDTAAQAVAWASTDPVVSDTVSAVANQAVTAVAAQPGGAELVSSAQQALTQLPIPPLPADLFTPHP